MTHIELAQELLDLAILNGVYDYEIKDGTVELTDLEDANEVAGAVTLEKIGKTFYQLKDSDKYPAEDIKKALEFEEEEGEPYLGMLDPNSATAVIEIATWGEIVTG